MARSSWLDRIRRNATLLGTFVGAGLFVGAVTLVRSYRHDDVDLNGSGTITGGAFVPAAALGGLPATQGAFVVTEYVEHVNESATHQRWRLSLVDGASGQIRARARIEARAIECTFAGAPPALWCREDGRLGQRDPTSLSPAPGASGSPTGTGGVTVCPPMTPSGIALDGSPRARLVQHVAGVSRALGDRTFANASFVCTSTGVLELADHGAIVVETTARDTTNAKPHLVAIDSAGAVRWEAELPDGQVRTAALVGDRVVLLGAGTPGFIAGIDAKTGRTLYTYDGARR